MNDNDQALKEQETRLDNQKQYDKELNERTRLEQINAEDSRRREDMLRQEENRRTEKKNQDERLRQEEKKDQGDSQNEIPKEETPQRDLQAERHEVSPKKQESNYYKQSHLSPKEFESAYQNVMNNLEKESQNHSKGSSAIEKLRAYEESVKDKVQERLAREQMKVKDR